MHGALLDVKMIVCNITFPIDAMPGSDECFNITILEDMLLEGEEYLTLEVSSDDAIVGNPNVSFTITDRDTEGMAPYILNILL